MRRTCNSLLRKDVVGDRSGIDRQAVVMKDLPQLGSALGAQREPHQAQHLRVPILFDDIDALVMIDEGFELLGERIRPSHDSRDRSR